MSQVFATPTKHDLNSLDLDDTFYPLERTPNRSQDPPGKSVTKKKSIIALAFGSLRSRFRGNERPNTVSPTPDEPITPKKLLTWRSNATLRGPKCSTMLGNNRHSGHCQFSRLYMAEEHHLPELVTKARRRRSLGDLLNSVRGKKSQKQIGIPSVIVTFSKDEESETNSHDSQALLSASGTPQASFVRARESTRESDVFSMRERREPLRPMDLKNSKSIADFRLPPPAQRIDTPQLEVGFQCLNDLTDACYGKEGSEKDSSIAVWSAELDAHAYPDCRGAQQEDRTSPGMGTWYCEPEDFEESLFLAVPAVDYDFDIPGCADDDPERINWLFEQISKDDGIWPSSNTYLREIISSTGDKEDRAMCVGVEEDFRGLSPDSYLRRVGKDLASFQSARSQTKELKDSFQTNQYLELTSSKEVLRVVHPSTTSRSFKLLANLKDEVTYSPAQSIESEESPTLSPDFTKRDLLEGGLQREVKTLDFDTFFPSIDLRAQRHDALLSEKPQNKLCTMAMERRIARTAAAMSKNYRLACPSSDSDDEDLERYWDITIPDEESIRELNDKLFEDLGIETSLAMNKRLALEEKNRPPERKREVIGYEDEAHRIETLRAMEQEREEDLEEENHLAIQRMAKEEWNPKIRDIESFLKYNMGTFETICSYVNYVPQKHIPGWTDMVLEHSIDLRSIAQQSFEELQILAVTGGIPLKKKFHYENGACVNHIEDLQIEDDIFDIYDVPRYRTHPPGFPGFIGIVDKPFSFFRDTLAVRPKAIPISEEYYRHQNGYLATIKAKEIKTSSVTSESADEHGTPSLASEGQLEVYKPPVIVSFPRMASSIAYIKFYNNRDDAIMGIQRLCGKERSELCAYDPRMNVIHLYLKDVEALDIIADVELKGYDLEWLPIEQLPRNDSAIKSSEEQGVDRDFEDFVFNCKNSETSTENDSSISHFLGPRKKRSLSSIEPFPAYQADAPSETFGGSPIELVEPFPKFEEHSSIGRFSENDQYTDRVCEVSQPQIRGCRSEEAEVDTALARQLLGSELYDNYLDGNQSCNSVASSVSLCTENDTELSATFSGGSPKNRSANTADAFIRNDSPQISKNTAKFSLPATLGIFGSRIMTQRVFSSDLKQEIIKESSGLSSTINASASKQDRDEAKDHETQSTGVGQDYTSANIRAKSQEGVGRDDTSSDNSKSGSDSTLESPASEISQRSGFKFTRYGDMIRHVTLEDVIPQLVKSRLMKNEGDRHDLNSTSHGHKSREKRKVTHIDVTTFLSSDFDITSQSGTNDSEDTEDSTLHRR